MMKLIPVFVSILVAVLLTSVLTLALGENPLVVAEVLIRGAAGTATAFGYTLYYATPLVFTGLAVSWALKAGLFNIGAEGQMTMGGIAMAAVGIVFSDLPAFVAWPLSVLAGFFAGAFWGGLVAWLKIRRGVHEVLGSILFNFISYGIAGFVILDILRNHESQNPETLPIGESFQLQALSELMGLGGTSPLNSAFFLALGAAVLVDVVLQRTLFGLRIRWTGGAPEFARRSGISISATTLKAFAISGGIAGLAGASAVLGYMHKAREGFAAGAGFVGIAVALLGGGRAWGVVAAAILFGGLQKGSLDLDLDTEKISRDLAVVVQALIVLAVASRGAMIELWHMGKAKLESAKAGRI
jgi:general nucleoside transport system permease protein